MEEDATLVIKAELDKFGLGDLASVLWERMGKGLVTQDMTTDQKLSALRDTDQYKRRFKVNELRVQGGLSELPPSEIVRLENEFKAVMNMNNMPLSFYDQQEDFDSFIAGDTSPAEVNRRIQQGYKDVKAANPEVVRQMKELYGVDDSMLAAYFLDPVRTEDVIMRQAENARVSAQAKLQAGMQLTQAEAEQLGQAQINEATARQTFGQIGQMGELFRATTGEAAVGEQGITREEQIGGMFGTSAAAQQRIATRARRRKAEFEAGGGFGETQAGVTGLRTVG